MTAETSEPALVRFGGQWYEALVVGWLDEDDGWWAIVQWQPPSGADIRGTFPETDVRLQRAKRHT